MLVTVNGEKLNSNMQQMGETREPMARDCWRDAQRIADLYAPTLNRDFWILYAAKPHATIPRALVAGWEVVAKRPPRGMVGVLVMKWNHRDKNLEIDEQRSLPPDVPLYEEEMSDKSEDFIDSVAQAGEESQSILLA